MRILRTVHTFYKAAVSPLFGESCRFFPCCSDYFLSAVEQHGLPKGVYFTIKRVLRCNPYCKGGLDPVPQRAVKS